MVKVKICGIRNIADAVTAVEAGADALGFIFAASKRKVEPATVKNIISKLPPFVTTVGVFVNEAMATVQNITEYCHLNMVQLHGEESPEYCKQLNLPIIKGFRVKDEANIQELNLYQGLVRGLLLDSYVPGTAGGTGQVFDWSLALKAKEIGPIIVAGGLTPDNVSQAIMATWPYAVDVSSGLETEGLKDVHKINKFMQEVRRMNYVAR